ncbi:MAG TPA: NlpC/P60 family protein [Ilumatobacter sp.]|nr:NlpC/P60 family protein [Ilumatobacter sp.]
MTRHSTTPSARAPHRGSVIKRLVAAVAVGGSTLAVMVAPAGLVSAERAATTSEAIARRSQHALDSLAKWEADRMPTDYVRYVRTRDGVAEMIAHELGLERSDVRDEFATPALVNQHAALAALTQLGVAYRTRASNPGVGFDCSGLTSFAYATAGVTVPRSSGDQLRASDRVPREEAEVGDLVHYPGHVGIYLGGDIYVHSPEPGRHVEIVVMPSRSLSFGDLTL